RLAHHLVDLLGPHAEADEIDAASAGLGRDVKPQGAQLASCLFEVGEGLLQLIEQSLLFQPDLEQQLAVRATHDSVLLAAGPVAAAAAVYVRVAYLERDQHQVVLL